MNNKLNWVQSEAERQDIARLREKAYKMGNEINKARLESFFESVIWIPNPKFQNFCRDKFKQHETNIAEVDWFGSGGGCYHLLFRLSDGHIIAMHTDSNVCEHSFDTWDSIEEYCSEESNDKCKGFGWEHESSNYRERCEAMV